MSHAQGRTSGPFCRMNRATSHTADFIAHTRFVGFRCGHSCPPPNTTCPGNSAQPVPPSHTGGQCGSVHFLLLLEEALTGPASRHVLGKGPSSLGGRVMCTGLLPAPGPLPLTDAQVVPLGHEAGAGGWILPPAGSPPCPCPQEGPGGRLSSCEAGVPSGCPRPGLAAWGSRQCSSRAGPGRPGHARWWGRWLRT